MKLYLAADHAGFNLKQDLKVYLSSLDYEVLDCGNQTLNPNDDYPDFILPLAKEVTRDRQAKGIIIGGTGQGEAIAANKLPGVRAAVFYGSVLPKQAVDAGGRESTDPYEIVRLSRLHNDSNVLSLGARFISSEEAKQAIVIWLQTKFSGEQRYQRRIKQVDELADGTNG